MLIHEFGCAAAHLLSKLRNIYKPAYTICNDNARYANRDTAIIFNQEMSFDSVLTNSVDLFVSSHVVEHVTRRLVPTFATNSETWRIRVY